MSSLISLLYFFTSLLQLQTITNMVVLVCFLKETYSPKEQHLDHGCLSGKGHGETMQFLLTWLFLSVFKKETFSPKAQHLDHGCLSGKGHDENMFIFFFCQQDMFRIFPSLVQGLSPSLELERRAVLYLSVLVNNQIVIFRENTSCLSNQRTQI